MSGRAEYKKVEGLWVWRVVDSSGVITSGTASKRRHARNYAHKALARHRDKLAFEKRLSEKRRRERSIEQALESNDGWLGDGPQDQVIA